MVVAACVQVHNCIPEVGADCHTDMGTVPPEIAVHKHTRQGVTKSKHWWDTTPEPGLVRVIEEDCFWQALSALVGGARRLCALLGGFGTTAEDACGLTASVGSQGSPFKGCIEGVKWQLRIGGIDLRPLALDRSVPLGRRLHDELARCAKEIPGSSHIFMLTHRSQCCGYLTFSLGIIKGGQLTDREALQLAAAPLRMESKHL